MNVAFVPRLIRSWPKLAWVARCTPRLAVEVIHGPMVEIGKDWFGEITWNGPYDHAAFDQAEYAFGSGGRLRDHRLHFVGSSSVVDRLQWFQKGSEIWVSNTLAGLLSTAQVEVDDRNNYTRIFKTVCKGTRRYQKQLPMKHGCVHLEYMSNLVWDGSTLTVVPRKFHERKWDSFEEYRDDLFRTMQDLGNNWSHPARHFPYSGLSTISTGYDSPTATVVGLAAGLQETLSIRQGRSGQTDDGSHIARTLGLNTHTIDRDAWRLQVLGEATFLASDGKGEDVYVSGAGELLNRRVILTGYAGKRVWSVGPELCPDYERSDQSGLSHTEARLHFGYLHLPVPFLLSHQPADLRRISANQTMLPWHVEGSYNRPLARRLVEDAGVARHQFGMKKNAASILLFNRHTFLSEQSLIDFSRWYNNTYSTWQRAVDSVQDLVTSTGCRLIRATQTVAGGLASVLRSKTLWRIAGSSRLKELGNHHPQFRHLFPWAIERTMDKYHLPEPVGNSQQASDYSAGDCVPRKNAPSRRDYAV